jgi:hypothetical protein
MALGLQPFEAAPESGFVAQRAGWRKNVNVGHEVFVKIKNRSARMHQRAPLERVKERVKERIKP